MVKKWRILLNMTQKEFAGYFNIPLQTVQHWEQGFRHPPKYVVDLIERVMIAEHLCTEKELKEVKRNAEDYS